jgi:DDE family transposase
VILYVRRTGTAWRHVPHDPQPSAAVLDSQTAHGHEGGDAIGWDASKRTRGRKRHILVDTSGLLLKAFAHAASVQQRAGAELVLAGITATLPLLGLVGADTGYVNRIGQKTEAARRLNDELDQD